MYKGLLVCVLMMVFSFGYSQTGTLRGYVYDMDSGEPVIYGTLVIEGTDKGENTDFNGFYNFSNLDAGTYTLKISYLGYEDVFETVEIRAGGIATKSFYMQESGIEIGVIDISAQRQTARTEVQVSKIEVSQKQIKALPSTGGDADIIQYLQVLPGVISTGDQGGQLYIRGGSPVQNKILLDGLTIYNPFHSIGFFSVFETELIRKVDVLTGAFNAEHGGRISAVVDIHTREGDRTHLGGQISASPFMVKGLFEGPIKKFEQGKGSTSFILTAKKSVIDQTSQSLYQYAVDQDSIGLPFDFLDLYGKLSFITSNGSKFHLFGFNFDDSFNNPSVANIDWTTAGGGANFTLVPTSSGMILGGLIGFSDYEINLKEDNDDPRSSKIRELTAGLDFTSFGVDSEFNYGFEIKSIRTDFEFTNPFGHQINEFQNTTEFSAFFKFRKVFGEKLIFEPGIRTQFYASQSSFSPEPRLGLKYNVSDALRLKLAAGLYSQNILSTSNERDVVNLFSGFLTGPESQVADLEGGFLTDKIQTSAHAVAGFEYDINSNLMINIEGYYKDFNQLIIVNRNKLQASDPDFGTETGEAYGVDFSFNYQEADFNVYGAYSLGFVNRFDGEQQFPTVFDRRHNVNLLGTYNLQDNGDLQISGRWNMGSGFPFTKTQGFFYNNTFQDGVGTDILQDNPDDVGIIFSTTRNGGRLPYYHRFDISVTKKFRFSEFVNLEVVGSVTNVYNRDNIFFFDRIEFERVDQLPIIPSLAVRLNF
jgi:hypothetical protein